MLDVTGWLEIEVMIGLRDFTGNSGKWLGTRVIRIEAIKGL